MYVWIIKYRTSKFARWRDMTIADQVAESKGERPNSQVRVTTVLR